MGQFTAKQEGYSECYCLLRTYLEDLSKATQSVFRSVLDMSLQDAYKRVMDTTQ